jgi:Xaa-Pro dipeptidase
MRTLGIPAVLTANPINIFYATGVRNMTVFGLMGPSRFALVLADGPTILWEFSGCEHLVDTSVHVVHEIRDAPNITATGGPGASERATRFAIQIMHTLQDHGLCTSPGTAPGTGPGEPVAVEGVDYLFTDALRAAGAQLSDGSELFSQARRIKQPSEVAMMRVAVSGVEASILELSRSLTEGSTENEVWSNFHRSLIASDGEYVSTRLLQSGPNTFPYFQESGTRRIETGDLLCLDTDAIGIGGYAVDLSRTFVVGGRLRPRQRILYGLAREQLEHNASLLQPGLSYDEFIRKAWEVPAEYAPFGYYVLGHGIGLCGEYPNVPVPRIGSTPATLPGSFEPGMVFCVESYIGSAGQGVKLEDQFLITNDGAERLTNYPFLA